MIVHKRHAMTGAPCCNAQSSSMTSDPSETTCKQCREFCGSASEPKPAAEWYVKQSDVNACMDGIDERLSKMNDVTNRRLENLEQARYVSNDEEEFRIKVSTALSIIGASGLSKTADKDSRLYRAAELFLLEQVFDCRATDKQRLTVVGVSKCLGQMGLLRDISVDTNKLAFDLTPLLNELLKEEQS